MAQNLDYETPKRKPKGKWIFWLVFCAAYFPGLIILGMIDEFLQQRRGSHSDGGVMYLSLFCSPLFAGITGVVKTVWKRFDTVLFAAACAILMPVFALLGLVAMYVLSH